MTIKNKDGSNYELSKPNPIMKSQEFWDDYILHNFNSEETAKEIKIKRKYQKLEEIEPQEIKVPIKEVQIPKKKKEEPNKTLLYCMPATSIVKRDKLYDEERVSVSYNPQFTLECIVIEMNDLTCKMWINTDRVTKNSIFYMPKNIRWWKVEEITENNSGYIIACTPSSIQPGFAT